MAILVTRLATAVSSRKTPKMAINRNFPGATCIFSKCCVETKTKSKKFRIRCSKVPRVLEPLKSSYGQFSRPGWPQPFQAEKTPKMAINRNFPGLRAFSANVARDKNEEQEIPHPMLKIPRVLETLNPVMAILVTRLATAVSSRKTPKMAINRNFPGATCIFSKCCERQKRRARNSASDGQKYRAFWSP